MNKKIQVFNIKEKILLFAILCISFYLIFSQNNKEILILAFEYIGLISSFFLLIYDQFFYTIFKENCVIIKRKTFQYKDIKEIKQQAHQIEDEKYYYCYMIFKNNQKQVIKIQKSEFEKDELNVLFEKINR